MHACMQISKYHAVASHFTCMGTSRISGLGVWHGFEQAVFIGWLSNIIIGVCPMKISEGCPQYVRSVVHSIFGVCQMKISKGCP